MSTNTNNPSYKINVSQTGLSVEAPTKQECIDLFIEASKVKTKSPIDEALR
jgi:hypothetical protein